MARSRQSSAKLINHWLRIQAQYMYAKQTRAHPFADHTARKSKRRQTVGGWFEGPPETRLRAKASVTTVNRTANECVRRGGRAGKTS